jgi:hypothetical protein
MGKELSSYTVEVCSAVFDSCLARCIYRRVPKFLQDPRTFTGHACWTFLPRDYIYPSRLLFCFFY